MTIKFRRDAYELMVESVKKDNDTYLDETEKALILSLLHHFFDVKDWKNFTEIEVGLNDYNKYYKENYQKHHSVLEEKYIVQKLQEEQNESTGFEQNSTKPRTIKKVATKTKVTRLV